MGATNMDIQSKAIIRSPNARIETRTPNVWLNGKRPRRLGFEIRIEGRGTITKKT